MGKANRGPSRIAAFVAPFAIGALFGFRTLHFALINMALIAVWLVLVVMIGREHRKVSEQPAAAAAVAAEAKAA